MDGCGSCPLDVCEDMMKMEMFLSSFPKLAPFASGQQLGGGLYFCVCVYAKEEVAVLNPSFMLFSLV